MKKLALAVVVVSLQSPVFSQSASPQPLTPSPQSVAITHITVIDTAAGTAAGDMTVVIKGDHIVSVGKGQPPVGARVVEGRGKFLIPGLWDMHTHLSYARASALPVLAATGVTYVRDLGSDLKEIDRWRAQIAAGEILGPAILRAGPILNGQKSNRYHLVIATAEEARMAARMMKAAGVDVLKTHRLTSRDAYFALADEAKTLGLPLVGHVPMTVTPAEASDAGQQTIEHIETFFEGTFATAHGGQVTAASMAEWRTSPDAASLFATLARNGTVVDPTIVATGYLARIIASLNADPRQRYLAASARRQFDEAFRGLLAPQRDGLAPDVREREAVARQMQRAGVTLVTGTDTSFIHPPGFALHDELDMLAEAGLTPAEILRAATTNCAALFPSLHAGSVAAGTRADLVLLNANPLADIRNAHEIHAVVLRGRVLNRSALDRALADAVRLAATQ
jgi:imidazolonepropionase-like amidohydrolase